ncbi:MAG: hypothetical protein ABIJ61_13520, partial [bacterium]
SSLFSATMAVNSLLWIHVRGDRPTEALEAVSWLEERYPGSHTVLWGEAFAREQAGHYRQSIEVFGQLIVQIESQPSNYFNLIECRYHRGRMYQALSQTDLAAQEFEALLGYPVGDEVRERQRERLEQAAEELSELRAGANN